MFGEVVAPDQDIVQINCYLAFDNEISEDSIHKTLKRCRQIGKTKEHDFWFKETAIGNKGGFPFVSFWDTDIMIALTNVKLSEDLGTLELVDYVGS